MRLCANMPENRVWYNLDQKFFVISRFYFKFFFDMESPLETQIDEIFEVCWPVFIKILNFWLIIGQKPEQKFEMNF